MIYDLTLNVSFLVATVEKYFPKKYFRFEATIILHKTGLYTVFYYTIFFIFKSLPLNAPAVTRHHSCISETLLSSFYSVLEERFLLFT